MFETRKQLLERIEAQDNQIEALNAELEAANKAKEDAEGRIQEAADELNVKDAALAKALGERDEAAELANEHAEKIDGQAEEIKNLKAAAEETEQKVAEAAAKELAAAGHEPVEEVSEATNAGPLTREEFDAQYNAIEDGKARSLWFRANKHRLSE